MWKHKQCFEQRKLHLFKYPGLFSRRDAIPDQYYENSDDLETVPFWYKLCYGSHLCNFIFNRKSDHQNDVKLIASNSDERIVNVSFCFMFCSVFLGRNYFHVMFCSVFCVLSSLGRTISSDDVIATEKTSMTSTAVYWHDIKKTRIGLSRQFFYKFSKNIWIACRIWT